MNFFLNALFLFIIGCITDTIWVLYITNVTAKKKAVAANYSVLTGLCGYLWLEGMLESRVLVIFWLAGLWCGTYYAESVEGFIKSIMHKMGV